MARWLQNPENWLPFYLMVVVTAIFGGLLGTLAAVHLHSWVGAALFGGVAAALDAVIYAVSE